MFDGHIARPVVAADAPAITAAVDQSRDALRRWMAWYRDDYDVDAASAWIEVSRASAAAGIGYEFAILDGNNDVVGVIGARAAARRAPPDNGWCCWPASVAGAACPHSI